MTRWTSSIVVAAFFLGVCTLAATAPVLAKPLPITPSGDISIPVTTVPSSSLMSEQGNASRVEHILLKRSLKGLPTRELYRKLFGPGLARMQAAFPVTIRKATMGGVPVLIYEPRSGIAKKNAQRVLINLHGGGFVACFVECGGMESIPLAALIGIRVISIDYREAPSDHYPAATEDAAAVYRAVLKTYSAQHIGIYGCSAGGLLTAQTLAWIVEHHLPIPAAAGIFCAGGDPAMPGDSRIIGHLLGDGEAPDNAAPIQSKKIDLSYMRGAPKSDPAAYPARFPTILAKFPSILIITGTRDFAMSSAVDLDNKLTAAGVDTHLHVWDGARHAFFYDVRVPESHQTYAIMAQFFDKRL